MPDQTISSADRAALRRVKRLADAVLAGSLALMVAAKILAARYPAFDFVAAFAEAATIGGLADWYAVVALFRRPLGLPIPHTAIIPANRHRIAAKLGSFVEERFLDAAPVEAKLRQTDFAAFVADWLSDPKRSADLARFAVRLMPEVIGAADSSGLTGFVGRRVRAQLETLDLAPMAATTLRGFVEEGRHQALLDVMLKAVHGTLLKPETLAALRDKIRDELPTLLRIYRADAFLQKKIAGSAAAFFEEVQADKAHPFRAEVDRMILGFVARLESDPALAVRVDEVKREALASPQLAGLAASLWSGLRAIVDSDMTRETALLEPRLAELFRAAGLQLAADDAMRAEVNHGVVAVAVGFVAQHKSGVAPFIAEQVEAWDMGQLIELIETNVGRDLQYIRFNGALIGGLAGLALYTGEVVLRMW